MKAENREYCGDSRLESRNNDILEGHYEPQNELEIEAKGKGLCGG
jgi:hypothetical protein